MWVTELIRDAIESVMCPVLDLDPVRRPAGTVWTITAFRNQAFQAHVAGGTKEVGADLALFEIADEDALRSPR